MAYLETLKSSQTWTCPKTGYYQVICVGGGGGGGGAGFHFTGALFTPSPINLDGNNNLRRNIGFKSATSGFISATTKGGNGGTGGSTSFGSLLTAIGGQGGNGGGNTLGTTYPSANLNPSGGKSLMSAGGSGASVSSALNILEPDNVFRPSGLTVNLTGISFTLPSNSSTTGNPECLTFSGDNSFATPDGVLSAVSGGGGAGGSIETKTLFITKGTQIACTVGKGGSIGANGSYTANTKATISVINPGKSVISATLLIPNTIESAHNLYLLANVKGGGGGGGFTFEHSGGRGAEMQSEPLLPSFSRVKYHYCNTFKEVEKEPTGNGGRFTTGFGYGAGGSGGSINTRIALGLILPKSTKPFGANVTTPRDFDYTIKSGCFGGTNMSLNNEGNTSIGVNSISGVQLNSPDYCNIINASEGVSGAIVIREVS